MEHERAVQNLAVECYLLGEMTPGEREAFEEHYFECAICAEDMRTASQFLADAKGILAADRIKAALAPRDEIRSPRPSGWNWLAWLQPQMAAAAIAILLVVAGVETISTIPGLRRQVEEAQATQVVRSQVLRGQTRGAATILNVPAGTPAILTFDLPEFPALSAPRGLQFVVKSADGRAVLEIPGGSFRPGDPVTLSIPKLDLPAGNYILSVEATPETGRNGQELGRYPFELKRQ
jgi:anti-sigma factor RsiW